MKISVESFVLIVLHALFLGGTLVESLSYDHSASVECLAEPLKPQYEGGIIQNPEFNTGLSSWSSFSYAKIKEKVSKSGNKFAVAHSRSKSYHSISQKVYLQKGKLYTFSAWLQINEGEAPIRVVFKTRKFFTHAGSTLAKSGCWSLLKGGLSVEASDLAEIYFESENIDVDIMVDSVSLQPFSKKQWRDHQTQNIDKLRKRTVRFQLLDANGQALSNSTVSIKQLRHGFPVGASIASTILNNPAYQNWFTSRFTVATFENEMKWYSTEANPGQENYATSDAMLRLMQQHRISVRGHNVLWDDPNYQLGWVKHLAGNALRQAINRRVSSVVSRYKNQVIHWDVVNEDLHFRFWEEKLGNTASETIYQMTHRIDPRVMLFLNDFNTLEQPGDPAVMPARYIAKLDEIWRWVGNAQFGIGLEGHFTTPNMAYMRSALDTLAGARVPIWLTEVDVTSSPNQAQYLHDILREALAHPAVQGIVIWAAWRPGGCYRMCLTDNNFRNLPTGDVVDRFIASIRSKAQIVTTDSNGFVEAKLFHGDYEISVNHSTLNSTSIQTMIVDAGKEEENILHFKVLV